MQIARVEESSSNLEARLRFKFGYATVAAAVSFVAFGAFAIGRLSIRRLLIRNVALKSVEIGELDVKSLHVGELIVSNSLKLPGSSKCD